MQVASGGASKAFAHVSTTHEVFTHLPKLLHAPRRSRTNSPPHQGRREGPTVSFATTNLATCRDSGKAWALLHGYLEDRPATGDLLYHYIRISGA